MRGWLISGLSVASGLAFVLAASGYAQSVPSYDGTGSIERLDLPPPPEKDVQADARMTADLEKQREKLTQEVAAGRIKSLTPLAAKLEYGDSHHAPDRAAAFDLYQKAADLGSGVGSSKMCIAYILGEGRPHDPARGLAYCDKLTDDSPTALFAHGYAAHEGIGMTADPAAARALFVKSVTNGGGPAADWLGRDALAAGKPEEARDWFRKGAFRGSADALDDMARMVESGQGGPQDAAEAYWLYTNAARAGNAHAAEWSAAHPDARPLDRLILEQGKTATVVTETFTDAKGQPQTRSVSVDAIRQGLQGYYPKPAALAHVSGHSALDCYVDAGHAIDACWLRREDPPGYEFGWALESLYEGHLTLAPTDVVGQSTAQRVFRVAIRWDIN